MSQLDLGQELEWLADHPIGLGRSLTGAWLLARGLAVFVDRPPAAP